MSNFIDITGKTFNRLTVIEPVGKKRNETLWRCKCECGNEIITEGRNIRLGLTKSCGCLKKETDRQPKGNVVEMTGLKIGHLTVVSRDGSFNNGQAKWLCKCDCGNPNLISVSGNNLRRGHTCSCGCDRRSHGEIIIENILKENNINYETEKILFKYSNGYNAKFDFFINNEYLIEYDGETHYKYNLHGWHNKEQLKNQQEKDMIKNQWCKENNIPLIRIPYTHLNKLTINDLLLETSNFIINKEI